MPRLQAVELCLLRDCLINRVEALENYIPEHLKYRTLDIAPPPYEGGEVIDPCELLESTLKNLVVEIKRETSDMWVNQRLLDAVSEAEKVLSERWRDAV